MSDTHVQPLSLLAFPEEGCHENSWVKTTVVVSMEIVGVGEGWVHNGGAEDSPWN